MPITTGSNILVRACTADDFDACVECQRCVWKFSDLETASREILIVADDNGGQVFGAFDQSRLIGFVLAFAGVRNGRAYLYSHMTAVLEQYRDQGIGYRLKLAQREEALARGIERIEWTFDPLKARNAHLNINRLGANVRMYKRNHWGSTSSPEHAGLPTDRLVAEWWLGSGRVEAALANQRSGQGRICERISVPLAGGEFNREDPEAPSIQAMLRCRFETLFDRGYVVTAFERGQQEACYVLQPYLSIPHAF